MAKTTLREIRGSFGRWIAILAIIALGVGFFSGLKVCKEDFIQTGDQYIKAHNLYDYELLTTLGLEEEDVEIIRQVEGVKNAEGSYSTDALIALDETEDTEGEYVATIHMISNEINTTSLKAGTMPGEPDQFIGDSRYFTEDDIGTTVKISDSNDKDTRDMFAYDEYQLTGIADSPVYLNFERGSTSLGNGTISFFMYIPEDGWDSDVYTEIYVDFAQDYTIFSEEYEANANVMEKRLTEALDQCGERRYDKIIDEAREKLADAEQQVSDAEAELETHRLDLINARQELEDGEQALEENRQKLTQAREEYEAGLASYEQERDAAYQQLDAALTQGLITQEQYEQSKAAADQQFAAAWSELESAKSQITSGEAELASAEAQLESARQQVTDGETQLADGQEQINEAKADLRDAEDEVDDIEYPTTYVLGRDTNIGYACFENDSQIVDGIAKIFPIFFFLVAALVCMTTMTRMIDEQRTQIGVLKALGYERRQILGKYIFYSGSAAVLGTVSGFAIGAHLFPWVIWDAYGMMYGFSDLVFMTDWSLCGFCLIVALLCSVGTTIYSCNAELKEVPAQLIRPKAPKSGKRVLLERIPAIWNRLRFLQKVSIRNTFRYKKRFFMMVLGICGCTALLVTGLGIRDSISGVVASQYDEIFHVDYTVTFNKDMDSEAQDLFTEETSDVISDCLFLYTSTVDVVAEDSVKTVNLVVCDENEDISTFVDLHNDDGKITYPGKGEGVINSALAENLGLEPGDTITVRDENMRELTVTISAICDNYVYHYLYINEDTYADQWGTVEKNSAFALGVTDENGEVADPHGDGAVIMNARNVSAVSITSDFRDRIDTMMQSLNYIVILVVISAGALAFIVLYNLTNINITERIREIATIKVLGFYAKETASYVFRENIILTTISALIGLPLGKALLAFVISYVKIDMLHFDVRISLLSYVLGFVLTFVFAFIVNLVMQIKLSRISMTESLKSVE